MSLFLYLISLLWIAAGVCYILYTEKTRAQVVKFTGANEMVLGGMTALVGLLLFFVAGASEHGWLIRILGLLVIAKGVVIFLNPAGLRDKMFDWYLNRTSEQTDRLYGIIMIVLGTALLSWIQ